MKYASKSEHIGFGVVIDPTAQFSNIDHLWLGDHSYIGPGVRVMNGTFVTGDHSKFHNNVLINGKNGVLLGHNTWIGQGSLIDGTGGVVAGDFLGVGINSALYSHIRHGDITEGCTYNKDLFLRIGHDVWFVGMVMVSPVVIEDKSVALLGSVVTNPMTCNRVYGGNPAKDLTDRIGPPWVENDLEFKRDRVIAYINEFCSLNPIVDRDQFVVCDNLSTITDDRTYFDVKSRVYSKTNGVEETQLVKWLFPYRAKFRPHIDKIPYHLSSVRPVPVDLEKS